MNSICRGLVAALCLLIALSPVGALADTYVQPTPMPEQVAPPPPEEALPPEVTLPPDGSEAPESTPPPDEYAPAQQGEDQTVLDSAGLFDAEFISELEERNRQLLAERGFQIAVVTVVSTFGEDTVDFAQAGFDAWALPEEAKAESLLLLLSVGDDDYCCISGEAYDQKAPPDRISGWLNEYLEPDFARGNYQEGVRRFFEAAAAGDAGERAPVQGYRA